MSDGICQRCGKEFLPRRYADGRLEAPSKYLRRKYCSTECAKKAIRVDVEPRYCELCGAEIERREYQGDRESTSTYKRRKFCSQACATKNLANHPHPGPYDSPYLTAKDWEKLAYEEGRVTGKWECPVCGMRHWEFEASQECCLPGVAEFDQRLRDEFSVTRAEYDQMTLVSLNTRLDAGIIDAGGATGVNWDLLLDDREVD